MGRRPCLREGTGVLIPYGLKRGGGWELVDSGAGEMMKFELHFQFNGVGRLVRVRGESFFPCPFHDADGLVH